MNKRSAAEIRLGIRRAQEVMRHERVAPKLSPWFGPNATTPTLFERAYHHTIAQAVRHGKLRPPKGPSPSYNSGIGDSHDRRNE